MKERVKLYVPREESFPIPLKYIDVIRSTHTDLDVAQEKRVDDNWNVDGNRNLSDSWTEFTTFSKWNETPPKGYVVRGRLTKIQTTSRPYMAWRLDKGCKSRSKKRNTRMGNREFKTRMCQKLERIHSIDPSDEEYKDIIKKRRKLETAKAAAMACKRTFSQACIRETVVSKTKKAKESEAKTRFTAEAHASTRQRIESVTKRIHEEHIAGKGQNSELHYN